MRSDRGVPMGRRHSTWLVVLTAAMALASGCAGSTDSVSQAVDTLPTNETLEANDSSDSSATTTTTTKPVTTPPVDKPIRVADDEITPLQEAQLHDFITYGTPWLSGPLEVQAGAVSPLFLEPATLRTTQLGTDITFTVSERFTLNHDWPGIVGLTPGDAEGRLGENVLLFMRPTDLYDPAAQTTFPPHPGRAVAPLEPTSANLHSWFEQAAAIEAVATPTSIGGLPATQYDVTVEPSNGTTWFCNAPGVGCVDWIWSRSCLCGNIAFKSNELSRVWVVPLEGQPPLVFFTSSQPENFDEHEVWAQSIIDSVEIGQPEPSHDDPSQAIAPFESLTEGTYSFPAIDGRTIELSRPLSMQQHRGHVKFRPIDPNADGGLGLTRLVAFENGNPITSVDEFLTGVIGLDPDAKVTELPPVRMLGATARAFDLGFNGRVLSAEVPDSAGAREVVAVELDDLARIWLIELEGTAWMVHADAPSNQPEILDAQIALAEEMFAESP